MNIDVRYKYDKTFESTIKFRDYWTMTFLKGDYHLRPITENGYKKIVKKESFLLALTQIFRLIGKTQKRSINVFILSSKMRHRHFYFGRQWIWRLSCAHAPYYGLNCTNVVSTIIINYCTHFQNIHKKGMAKTMPWILQCLWYAHAQY